MEGFEHFTELLKKNQFTPIRELIFQYLRDAIVSGQMEPEDHLIEEELGKKLNVSRTPIREAIRKLELEGLVQRSPRRGVIVRKFSLNDVMEIYDIRSVLEGYAAKLAADNIEPHERVKLRSVMEEMRENIQNGNKVEEMEKHKEWLLTVYAASKNSRLEQLLITYADYLQFFRTVSLQDPGRSLEIIKEHESMTRAIETGDGELAEKIAREHVSKAKEAYLHQYQSRKEL